MPNWVVPNKKPIGYGRGLLVIESDDGNHGDYSRWFPMFKEISHEYSQFYPYNLVKAVCNVNSATIGDNGGERLKMSVDNLKALEKYGWEIANHGRHHVGLGAQPVLEDVSVGASTIKIPRVHHIIEHQGKDHRGIYTYRIFDEVNSETFYVNDGDRKLEEIYISKPLEYSYGTNAKVQMTDETAELILKGGRDDVRSWGLQCNNYAYPWHSGANIDISDRAMDWVVEHHDSGRGYQGILNRTSYDIRRLNSYAEGINVSIFDSLLDATQADNNVLILFGHGDHERTRLGIMEYVAREAMRRGMKIMTRRELLEVLL